MIQRWKNNKYLGALCAFDTETTIAPFTSTPDAVIGVAYAGDGDNAYIVDPRDFEAFFHVHRASSFIFHNAPFDIDVIKKVIPFWDEFALYDRRAIYDTGILYKLLSLAKNGWVDRKTNLARLAKEYCDMELDKEGDTRTTFGEYIDVPVAQIPEQHLKYAAEDAIATWRLYFELRAQIAPLDVKGTLLTHHIQVKGDLALNRIYKRGIEFDLDRRDRWLKAADARLERLQNRLATYGWVRGQKGVNERYEAIVNFLGVGHLLPRTKDGHISSASDDLEKFRDLPFIDDYLKFQELEKQTQFVRDQSETRIHPRYDTLKNTGRTGCSKPNIQNLPRKGAIRSMYKARPGHKLIITDYNAIELACLAQVCLNLFGESEMARLINSGECLHYATATSVFGKNKEDITKDERQFSKIPNFGYPTNMKPETFVDYCAGYGIKKTVEECRDVKEKWVRRYPEMRKFWDLPGYGANDSVTITGRVRAQAFYTAFLNTQFQGLAADGAKLALYGMEKEGMPVVAFVHDEVVSEVPDDENITGMVAKQEKIMLEYMGQVIPDVKIGVESDVVSRYTK